MKEFRRQGKREEIRIKKEALAKEKIKTDNF